MAIVNKKIRFGDKFQFFRGSVEVARIDANGFNLTINPNLNNKLTITNNDAAALAVGPNGNTNPVLRVVGNITNAATGLSVTGRAAASGVDLAVLSSGTNENLRIDAKGSGTVTINSTATGAITLARATGVSGALTVTSAAATALAVGANGATNPVFVIDASTGSSVTGLSIKGAAVGGRVAVAAISSGADEGLDIDAKGAGTIRLGNASTGNIVANRALAAANSVLSSHASAGIGYTTGAGGTVTQSTSKSTGVTINRICGEIVTANSSLAAGDEVTFAVTNSAVGANDVVAINHKSGGTIGAYLVSANNIAAGSFSVTISNLSAGALAEAITLGFAIIKAAVA